MIIEVDIVNCPLPFCAKWASADVVFIVVDVDLVFVDNAFSIKRIFMYNLIIDVDIVSRALPFSAEWASADGSYNNQLLKYWRQLLRPLKVIKKSSIT